MSDFMDYEVPPRKELLPVEELEQVMDAMKAVNTLTGLAAKRIGEDIRLVAQKMSTFDLIVPREPGESTDSTSGVDAG